VSGNIIPEVSWTRFTYPTKQAITLVMCEQLPQTVHLSLKEEKHTITAPVPQH
jgi:hypothetical protein